MLELAATTLTLAVAVAVLLLVAVAVITALTGAEGAVYVVFAPLAVWAGLKAPHVPAGVHVQSTPAFAESFWTAAVSVAAPFTAREAGGGVVMVMLIEPVEPDTVTAAVATAEWLLVDVAVIITAPAEAGAVYVVVAPLAV